MAGNLQEQSRTIIQNKNVNVIVNLNVQDVAEELWKVIEARLNNRTHLTSSKSIMKDLKEAVTPLVSPTRKSKTSPSVFQVASQLDKITRRALTRDTPTMNMLDEEIMARDIVTDMMVSLKMYLSKKTKLKDNENIFSRRTIYPPISMNNNEQDDYINVKVKIRRKDILDVLY